MRRRATDRATGRPRGWAVMAVVALAAPVGGACQPGVDCTLIGCEDGITVQIGSEVLAGAEGDVTVETCVQGACRRERVDPDALRHGTATGVPTSGLAPGDEVAVTVTASDGAGVELVDVVERVTMERSQPNGPDCEPVCVVGGVTVGAALGGPDP